MKKPGRPKLKEHYKVDENGCWIWQGAIVHFGYGAYTIKNKGVKKRVYAHRYYYEKYKGKIPKGLVIDHLCRVSACCNPDHLEAVTQAENCRRGSNAKITRAIAEEIRKEKTDYLGSKKHLMKKYGLSRRVLHAVLSYESWR